MRLGDASLEIEILADGRVLLEIERNAHTTALSVDQLKPLVEEAARRTLADYVLPTETLARLTWSTSRPEDGGPWDFSLGLPEPGAPVVARFRANAYTGEVIPLIVNLPKKPAR
jgi:hypothetical protein